MTRMFYSTELKAFLDKVPNDTSICLDCGVASNGIHYEGWEKIGWEHCDCDENVANELKYRYKESD